MKPYVKPKIEVMLFRPDEYVAACDGSVTANVTCIYGGSVKLSGGYDNGNGLFTFPSGQQLYTNVYESIDGEKDTSIPGVLVGTIADGHNADTRHPRQDGEFSVYGESNRTIYCAHAMIGTDGGQKSNYQHHHLSTVIINNHS